MHLFVTTVRHFVYDTFEEEAETVKDNEKEKGRLGEADDIKEYGEIITGEEYGEIDPETEPRKAVIPAVPAAITGLVLLLTAIICIFTVILVNSDSVSAEKEAGTLLVFKETSAPQDVTEDEGTTVYDPETHIVTIPHIDPETTPDDETDNDPETPTHSEPGETETKDPRTTVIDTDTDVAQLIADYYAAVADGDAAAYLQCVDVSSLSSKIREELEFKGEIVESYSDFDFYMYQGVKRGEFIVYVASQIRFVNIDMPAPSLARFYIVESSDGYRIHTGRLNSTASELMNDIGESEDIVRITGDVNSAFENACDSDEKLKQLMELLDR